MVRQLGYTMSGKKKWGKEILRRKICLMFLRENTIKEILEVKRRRRDNIYCWDGNIMKGENDAKENLVFMENH